MTAFLISAKTRALKCKNKRTSEIMSATLKNKNESQSHSFGPEKLWDTVHSKDLNHLKNMQMCQALRFWINYHLGYCTSLRASPKEIGRFEITSTVRF